eukprot:Gregarina_sp_Pseudo_9__1397@NODE_1935_length_1245_cov_1091_189055_g1794_i0_p1_GENE_NODE_1935_length_1245_cov_1091_189055_g1794_i0NODE_1935_length_1245_cov_1091_189055_g1794_i0_p1_ORF_typecomplete_len226_score70_14BsuBI_PstI_RE_N/PF17728_1/0_0078_NODE_1935_length_1245_cov_1091_189055_g1794_i0211888
MNFVGAPNPGRMGSLASIGQPMAVQRSDPSSGTVYLDRGETSTVQVHTLPPRTFADTQATVAGMVRYQESRHAMTPTVAGPQTVNTNVWSEDLQPTYSTKSYETIRRDPATLFPGANIVSVGAPGVVTTSLGSIYNPRDNSFYSRLTNQTVQVEPLGAANYYSASPYTPYTNAYTPSMPIPPANNPTYQVNAGYSPQKTSTGSTVSNYGGSMYPSQSSNWKRTLN